MITTSALLAATGLVFAGKCVLRGFMFTADTATEPTLLLSNSTTTTTLPKAWCMASDEQHTVFVWFGEEGIPCSLGIYATFATADLLVYYEIR